MNRAKVQSAVLCNALPIFNTSDAAVTVLRPSLKRKDNDVSISRFLDKMTYTLWFQFHLFNLLIIRICQSVTNSNIGKMFIAEILQILVMYRP